MAVHGQLTLNWSLLAISSISGCRQRGQPELTGKEQARGSLMHASSCLKEQLSKLGAQPGTQQPSGGPQPLSLGYCQPPNQCCHAKPCTCVYPSTCLQENVVLSLIAEDQGDLGLVLRVAQDVASHLQHGCHPAAAAHLQTAALSSLADECGVRAGLTCCCCALQLPALECMIRAAGVS